MSSRPPRWKRVRVSGGSGEFGDEMEEVFEYVPPPPSPPCNRQEPLSTNTMILLFVLILIFVCMVAMAVALCRMGRIERSLDMMTLIKHMSPPVATIPTTAPPSMLSGGDFYRPGVPIQLPIPPPYL